MNSDKNKYFILVSSFTIAALLIITSCSGIFIADFYAEETANWQAQSVGQDMINLGLIAPLLIISAVYAAAGNKFALRAWFGVILYLIYTFIIYCFSIHFNSLFLLYCITLGLSFYAVIVGSVILSGKPTAPAGKYMLHKIAAIIFIVTGLFFYATWLSEIIPATLSGSIPQTLKTVGLVTNPVHVLDLSIVLPGMIICGIAVLQKRSWAIRLVPVLLTFMVLMTITITFLAFYMNYKDVA